MHITNEPHKCLAKIKQATEMAVIKRNDYAYVTQNGSGFITPTKSNNLSQPSRHRFEGDSLNYSIQDTSLQTTTHG